MSAVLAVTLLSLVVTKLVDTTRNSVDPGDTLPKVLWNVLAFGFGIAVAFIWGVNVFTELGADTQAQGAAGIVLTGFVIGGGSSGWHELLDRLSP